MWGKNSWFIMDHLRRKGLWSSNCVNTISIRSVAIDRVAEVELGVEEVDGHLEVGNVFGDSWPAGVVLPNGGAINYTCCFFWQLGICNMSSTCWWKCNAEICSTRRTVDQFSSNLRFFWSSFFDTSGQVQNFILTLLFSFMPRTSGKKLVQTIYISN